MDAKRLAQEEARTDQLIETLRQKVASWEDPATRIADLTFMASIMTDLPFGDSSMIGVFALLGIAIVVDSQARVRLLEEGK